MCAIVIGMIIVYYSMEGHHEYIAASDHDHIEVCDLLLSRRDNINAADKVLVCGILFI